ncbi:MAG: hypothetical protein IT374_17865 [Polyangiaceae bacterium]|nr:hypothetical protein [Polyangiaceae bacterium]
MIFGAWHQRQLGAIVEAMLTDHDERGELAPPSAEVTRLVVEDLSDWLTHSQTMPTAFKALIALLALLPLFFVGRLASVAGLPLDVRVTYLERFERTKVGPLSMAFIAMKVPLVISAYEVPENLRVTGFDRSLTERRRLPVAGASR